MKLVSAFQEMKRIYGFCPCCGELFRLSDAELFTKGAPPRTPFDRVADALERIERRAERFGEREAELRAAEVRAGQCYRSPRMTLPSPISRKLRDGSIGCTAVVATP